MLTHLAGYVPIPFSDKTPILSTPFVTSFNLATVLVIMRI